jgi:hypothetical protein
MLGDQSHIPQFGASADPYTPYSVAMVGINPTLSVIAYFAKSTARVSRTTDTRI